MQQIAWEEYEQADKVPDHGLRRAIGEMIGTEASSKVEQLLGVQNEPHIEDSIRCEEGSSAVTLRFALQDDDQIEELAAEEDALLEKLEDGEQTDMEDNN